MTGARLRRRLLAAAAVLGLGALVLFPPAGTVADPVPAPPPDAPPPLLTPDGPVDPDAGAGLDRAQPVEVREALLPPGQPATVGLDLLPGDSYTAVLAPEPSGVPGWSAWNGVLSGVVDSDVSLVRRNGIVTGLVTSPAGTFHLRFDGDEHQVEEVVGPAEPLEDVVMTPPGADEAPGGDGAAGADAPPPASGADPATVDVLVAYTPGAETAAGGAGAVQSLIASAISSTNSSYVNSDVAVELRLVGTHRTLQDGAADEGTLERLWGTTDGTFDEVHTKRDALGADLVALVVGGGGQYCGLAYYPTSLTDPAASSSSGFSVTATNCAVSNMSFAHELGHNLSAAHDRYVDRSNPFFTEGFGYVNTSARWRTVMAYNNECAAGGFNCTRLPRWSNPDQVHNGAPLGTLGRADNQNALNAAGPVVARYRAPAQATGSVTGTVRTTSGGAVGGVRVRTSDGAAAAVTGADGTYRLTGLQWAGTGRTYTVVAGACVEPAKSVVVNGAERLDFTATGLTGAGHRCTQDGSSRWLAGTRRLTALNGTDNGSVAVSLPFAFTHLGRTYGRVHVSTNGHLSFTAASTAAANTALPRPAAPNAGVYAFWDDLVVDASSGVYTATAGRAPNRRFAVEWRGVALKATPNRRITVEVVLHEDGRTRIEYRDLDPASRVEQGSSATVGIEDAAGSAGFQVLYNGAGLASGTGLTFTPAPPPATSSK